MATSLNINDILSQVKQLDKILESSLNVGLNVKIAIDLPIEIPYKKALEFEDQAQFHPLKYLSGLSGVLTGMGVQIYTETRATEIKEKLVKTSSEFEIKADHIVVATNTPINDLFTMHTKQYAYRTYVIGALLPKGSVEPALWWDSGDQDSEWITLPYHYVRLQAYDEQNDLLICGGEDHKTGQGDTEKLTEDDRFNRLEEWLIKRFSHVRNVIYRWSGQVMEPLDAMGFIGKNPGDKDIYIVTGDSGNGITHGTIAGMLISDLILGRENPWEKLYDPARITLKVTGDYLKEAANLSAQYGDYLANGDLDSIDQLASGEGAILGSGLKKYAVYKDENGTTYTYSAVCPHLGCIVQWNHGEKSFDCPCHGSRFSCHGKIMNGPALTDLEAVRDIT